MSTSLPSAKQVNETTFAGLSLRANFSWTFVGNVIYAATQWGLLTLLTKLFEPDRFGQYSLAFSIVTPIFVASAMQLRVVYVSDVEAKPDDCTIPQGNASTPKTSTFADYFVLRVATNLIALLLVALLAVAGAIPRHIFPLTFLLGCNQALVLIKDIYQGVMQKQGRMDLLSISKMLQGGASTAAAIAMALLTHSMLLVVLGMLLARLLVLVLYHIPQARSVHTDSLPLVTRAALKHALSWSRMWPLARTALPLAVVMLLINLHLHVPRYFLADLGDAAVGYFSAIASLAAIPELVTTALGQSAVRQLAIRFANDRRAYRILVGQLMAIGAALGLAGIASAIALGRPAISLLFRPEYATFTDVLIWLMVARMVLNIQSFLGYAMTAARWFGIQIWTYGLMLVSLFIAAWFMVPLWGGLGAAWATLASACMTLVATLGVAIFKYRKEQTR